ncbi:MAG: D-aminoacyl-tRNA deacylase [Planctomycetales bacterium]
MRACVQRVSRASVTVDEKIVGEIGSGLLVLLGVAEGDQDADADQLAAKIIGLRIFNDQDGKMNRDVRDVGGGVLVVSQFTLLGDCRKGRRPSFVAAAAPEEGNRLYERFTSHVRSAGIETATGTFRADMDVELVNDGPATLLLDSRKLF